MKIRLILTIVLSRLSVREGSIEFLKAQRRVLAKYLRFQSVYFKVLTSTVISLRNLIKFQVRKDTRTYIMPFL